MDCSDLDPRFLYLTQTIRTTVQYFQQNNRVLQFGKGLPAFSLSFSSDNYFSPKIMAESFLQRAGFNMAWDKKIIFNQSAGKEENSTGWRIEGGI